MERLSSEQKAQLARLTRKFRKELRQRAGSVCGWNAPEAEEAVQETLFRAVKHAATLETMSDDSVQRYLYKVLLNCLRDVWRRRNTETGLEALRDIPAPDPEPEHPVTPQAMAAALEELSPKEREALGHRLQGLRYGAIARVMNVSTGTVGAVLFHGRQKLRAMLLEPEDPPGRGRRGASGTLTRGRS